MRSQMEFVLSEIGADNVDEAFDRFKPGESCDQVNLIRGIGDRLLMAFSHLRDSGLN